MAGLFIGMTVGNWSAHPVTGWGLDPAPSLQLAEAPHTHHRTPLLSSLIRIKHQQHVSMFECKGIDVYMDQKGCLPLNNYPIWFCTLGFTIHTMWHWFRSQGACIEYKGCMSYYYIPVYRQHSITVFSQGVQ